MSAEMACLALTVYFEARGEEVNAQVAVAQTVVNRVEDYRFPDTLCEVVWQDRQFSWTHDGKSDTPHEAEAWRQAEHVAFLVMNGTRIPWLRDALWYHADYVSPYWAEHYIFLGAAGSHLFYAGDSFDK